MNIIYFSLYISLVTSSQLAGRVCALFFSIFLTSVLLLLASLFDSLLFYSFPNFTNFSTLLFFFVFLSFPYFAHFCFVLMSLLCPPPLTAF